MCLYVMRNRATHICVYVYTCDTYQISSTSSAPRLYLSIPIPIYHYHHPQASTPSAPSLYPSSFTNHQRPLCLSVSMAFRPLETLSVVRPKEESNTTTTHRLYLSILIPICQSPNLPSLYPSSSHPHLPTTHHPQANTPSAPTWVTSRRAGSLPSTGCWRGRGGGRGAGGRGGRRGEGELEAGVCVGVGVCGCVLVMGGWVGGWVGEWVGVYYIMYVTPRRQHTRQRSRHEASVCLLV